MTPDIAALLAIDGVSSGAIYALIAIGLVLIFSVTRVIFVPFGDIAAFAALTLAAFEQQKRPGTILLVAGLAVLTSIVELVSLARRRRLAAAPRLLAFTLVIPLAIALLGWVASGTLWPAPVRIMLSLLLVLPIAPLLDRLVFQPVADANVLLLMILAVALHFALVGLSLLFFGPEGVRTEPLTDYALSYGDIAVPGQVLLIVGAAVLFSLLLYVFFGYTITGKALYATSVNRIGARLVGIRPGRAGIMAYLLGSVMAGVSGVLISPVTTLFYDSGFLLGLLAFTAAIIGGLASYPLTALGAVAVGMLGSFASFYSSGYKEVLVFSLLIPVLLWRSVQATHSEEDIEE
jgi:branched-chain amino acid transport system permease protein